MNRIENQEQFYKEFYDSLEQELEPEGMHLIEIDVPKNNITLKGISIRCEEQSAMPIIYPESYYEDYQKGISIKDIISYVKDVLINGINKIKDLLKFSDRENVSTHLRTAIVNYENNKNWLKDIPHERIADLALYAKLRLEEDYAVIITNQFLSQLQLTKEELFKTARENMAKEIVFQSMGGFIMDVVSEKSEEPAKEDFHMMQSEFKSKSMFWILSTKDGLDGAALIADQTVMEKVSRKFPEGFYILPSSIYEVLILPKRDGLEVDELRSMVQSVNQDMVSLEEQLSDNVYVYSNHQLIIAGQTESIEIEAQKHEIKHRR